MLIRIRKGWETPPSEITPKAVFEDRRRFLRTAALAGAGLAAGAFPLPSLAARGRKLPGVVKAERWNKYLVEGDEPNDYDVVTQYNNFYEFGTGKDDPYENAQEFKTEPWTVTVSGACENPGKYSVEDLIKPNQLEERIYRFRCVEAWSMVVPWVGVPLADVIKRLGPTSNAKYVYFETLFDPKRMPGQRARVLDWPYKEGLRIDEAMNPLTLLTVGLYGETLPNQNGAPVRLVIPWKYGFKSIKSIVSIRFQQKMPPTSWSDANPREYGFYSNVNPEVSHPRWSQAKERRIGEFLRRPTLPFNGYGEEVASLYEGMDLRKWY